MSVSFNHRADITQCTLINFALFLFSFFFLLSTKPLTLLCEKLHDCLKYAIDMSLTLLLCANVHLDFAAERYDISWLCQSIGAVATAFRVWPEACGFSVMRKDTCMHEDTRIHTRARAHTHIRGYMVSHDIHTHAYTGHKTKETYNGRGMGQVKLVVTVIQFAE